MTEERGGAIITMKKKEVASMKKVWRTIAAFGLSAALCVPIAACSAGQDGKSAYEIAVENGFEGTEQEWL